MNAHVNSRFVVLIHRGLTDDVSFEIKLWLVLVRQLCIASRDVRVQVRRVGVHFDPSFYE